MPVRDAAAVAIVQRLPCGGYAVRRGGLVFAPDTDRIAALVAVLGTMILSGVVLGRRRETSERAVLPARR